jgi:hypothetical protein
MGIEWLRDLIICIFGVVAAGVLIFLAVLSYSLYRRAKSILDSTRAASTNIQDISSYVGEEIIKPLIQIVALIQGIRQGIDSMSKFFKK